MSCAPSLVLVHSDPIHSEPVLRCHSLEEQQAETSMKTTTLAMLEEVVEAGMIALELEIELEIGIEIGDGDGDG